MRARAVAGGLVRRVTLLQRASAAGYGFGPTLHVELTFDALKDDPRWVALVTPRQP